MMLYPASHWLGGLPQWSTDEEDVNGSGISESDMRAVRAQAARCRRQSPEAGGVLADDGAEYAELEAGCGCVFSDLSVHGSHPNLSDRRYVQRLSLSLSLSLSLAFWLSGFLSCLKRRNFALGSRLGVSITYCATVRATDSFANAPTCHPHQKSPIVSTTATGLLWTSASAAAAGTVSISLLAP